MAIGLLTSGLDGVQVEIIGQLGFVHVERARRGADGQMLPVLYMMRMGLAGEILKLAEAVRPPSQAAMLEQRAKDRDYMRRYRARKAAACG